MHVYLNGDAFASRIERKPTVVDAGDVNKLHSSSHWPEDGIMDDKTCADDCLVIYISDTTEQNTQREP